MSDGLSRVAGRVSATFVYRDTSYTLRVPTLGDIAELESYVASLRPNPLVEATKALDQIDAKHHDKVLAAAMEAARLSSRATLLEIVEFLHTTAGAAFMFWLLARGDCPMTKEQADEIVGGMTQAKMMELSALTKSLTSADLKNCDGPSEHQTPAGESLGRESTKDLPTGTTGTPSKSTA
jgi:hypothetical protein